MRKTWPFALAFALIWGPAFIALMRFHYVPYKEGPPPLAAVDFRDQGPRECDTALHCMPEWETACIVATGECRFVMHPLRHPFDVTVCWSKDSGYFFYTAARKECLRHV